MARSHTQTSKIDQQCADAGMHAFTVRKAEKLLIELYATVRHIHVYHRDETCGTLCGLAGGHGSSVVTIDPAQVTCKSCRQSAAWKGWSIE